MALSTLAFVLISFFNKEGQVQPFAAGVDWRVAPAGLLILFALWILAGLALLCSTRLELISTLAICSGFFLLGLMSDYLFGARADKGSWWASILYTLLPNWQQLWMADALDAEKSIPWQYVGTAFAYVVTYVGASLAAALCLFEDRELT